MEDQTPDSNSCSGQQGGGSNDGKAPASTTTVETVRSRWAPKPEQILILESIFNSGLVNPPKDETVRIRKLLEKFGVVGDANVFYWFQNRRSRLRRRQRQMQAGLAGDPCRPSPGDPRQNTVSAPGVVVGAPILYEPSLASPSSTSSSNSSGCGGGGVEGGFFFNSSSTISSLTTAASCCPTLAGDDSADDLFSISRQMGFPEFGPATCISPSFNVQDLHYQTGLVTVFINGIPSEVPGGPFDMRSVFGQDVILVHSSGEIVPFNEYGVLFEGLQMGENYFSVNIGPSQPLSDSIVR